MCVRCGGSTERRLSHTPILGACRQGVLSLRPVGAVLHGLMPSPCPTFLFYRRSLNNSPVRARIQGHAHVPGMAPSCCSSSAPATSPTRLPRFAHSAPRTTSSRSMAVLGRFCWACRGNTFTIRTFAHACAQMCVHGCMHGRVHAHVDWRVYRYVLALVDRHGHHLF